MDFRSLPKVELHLHLDCSLSYEAVYRLAPSVTREEYDRDYVAPARCTNLADFLTRAPKGVELMQTESSLQLVTQDLFRQLHEDGVVYAEIRFAPLLHLGGGLSAEEVVEAVDRATEAMIAETGIQARLILCSLRHFGEEQSMETAELVEKFFGTRVAALDLAADEAGFPVEAHIRAFRYAREQGLFRTAHAGEGRGPESVWETLRLLEPQRIGHGTRSIEDPELVEYLQRNHVHLELCPSANVQIIASLDGWEQHPIDQLYRAGVRLSVNTDSRMLTRTTLTQEYERLSQFFGWGPEQFLETNLMAVEAAFVDSKIKANLRERITSAYAPAQTRGV